MNKQEILAELKRIIMAEEVDIEYMEVDDEWDKGYLEHCRSTVKRLKKLESKICAK